jgi:TolB-like protein
MIKFLASIVLLTFTSCFSANISARAQLEYVDVTVEGVGASSQDAINAALIEAVGRVNGKSLQAKNAISNVSNSQINNNEEKFTSSETMQREYSEATNGVVASYQVLHQSKNQEDEVIIKLKAKIAKLKLSSSGKRLKIALVPFLGDEVFSRNFSNSLLGKLVGSRRFTVLDRQSMSEIAGEKAIASTSPLTSVAELAKLGSTLTADYIIVGSVEDTEHNIRKVYFPNMKKTFEIPEGKATINFKIIDVATSQVKYADNSLLGFDQQSFKKYLNHGANPKPEIIMAEIASSRVGSQILDAIYPVIIVGINDGLITLNQGGKLIKKGSIYNIYERGQKIFDPYTKELLGRSEQKVGELKINRVTSKMSYASLVNGKQSIFDDLRVGKYVCRLKKEPSLNSSLEKKKIKETIENKKNEFNDVW